VISGMSALKKGFSMGYSTHRTSIRGNNFDAHAMNALYFQSEDELDDGTEHNRYKEKVHTWHLKKES
jgi:hypothetical protein